jgi:hypothetical protein
LAVFSAIATSHTNNLVAHHVALPDALTSGFSRALLAASIVLVGAAVIALRATNTKGEPMPDPEAQQIVTEVDRQPVAVADNG